MGKAQHHLTLMCLCPGLLNMGMSTLCPKPRTGKDSQAPKHPSTAQIRIYWKILEAGKHIIDNNSGTSVESSASSREVEVERSRLRGLARVSDRAVCRCMCRVCRGWGGGSLG